MKTNFFIVIVSLCILLFSSCKDEFAEMNQDPSTISKSPAPNALFTYSLYRLGDYQYTEWFYDNYQYIMPWSQVTNASTFNAPDFEQFGATGNREYSMYIDVFANLFEMRKQIDGSDAETQAIYQNVRAISYLPQIMQAIKVTDIYGSIVYSEAMRGRYEAIYTGVFDNQEDLFDQLLNELDYAIGVLSTDHPVEQIQFEKRDFVYQGDVTKWIKFANTLKLRIATRLLDKNPSLAKQVIDEVIADPAGPIVSTDDEFRWIPSPQYRGTAHDLWGPPYATKNLTTFLKKNRDPRLRFWFEKNDFDSTVVKHFIDASAELPWFIPTVIDEPWDRYFGPPASPDSSAVPAGQTHNDYAYGFNDPVTNASKRQISILNRRLQEPQYNNGTGTFIDVMIPASESCLYFAEFMASGVITSATVRGNTAQQWYEAGVRASAESFDYIAENAVIEEYTKLKLRTQEVDTLLMQADYAWGTDNLEKVYIQEYLNFFRVPTELWTFVRRTGYPSYNSTILAREHLKASGIELVLPRRFPRLEIDDQWNIDNYHAAMTAQGFTLGKTPNSILNTERIWFDENNPDYGMGTVTK